MKRTSIILCILLLLIFLFTMSACSKDGYDWHITYNGMRFEFIPHKTENGKDYYYVAGDLENKLADHYFMPMFVNGLPVRAFGWGGFASNSPMNLEHFFLEKLYMPGTILEQNSNKYFSYVHQDMQVYYCGEVIDLLKISPNHSDKYKVDYYVPADKYDDFNNALGIQWYQPNSSLYKANISYRLNCEDMCEYYYVDNVEAGSKIENIPPEPTRAGYTFNGWYTEKECTNKWNFDNVPTVSSDDDYFVEFALYAKWIKA